MSTKKQLIKLLEKKATQETALRETEDRVRKLSRDLGCGDVLVNCDMCGEQMLVNQRMMGLVCRFCATALKERCTN